MSQAPVDEMVPRNQLSSSKLTGWLKRGRDFLYPYRLRWRDRRFWAVQALVIGIAAIHDIIEVGGYLPHLGVLYFLPISIFFVPVVYAAINFGFVGSIATALWVLVITIPNWVFWHQGLERLGVILQMAVLIATAIFVGHRVDRETSARRQAETASATLRTYAAHVVRAQEEERQHIARELHDETIQTVALLCRQLDSAISAGEPLPSSVLEELREARRISEEVAKGLRGFARALRPPILDDLGIVASIRRLLLDFTERTGTKSQLELLGAERRLTSDAELGLFRIAQEALSNVEHHSKATEVLVTMTFGEHKAGLAINDNGVGFNAPPLLEGLSVSGQLGLLGMQERAELLGGKLEIQSGPGKGTTISVTIPI